MPTISEFNRQRFAFVFLATLLLSLLICVLRKNHTWPRPLEFSITVPVGQSAGSYELFSAGGWGKTDSLMLIILPNRTAALVYKVEDQIAYESDTFHFSEGSNIDCRLNAPDKSYTGAAIATTSGIFRIEVAGRKVLETQAIFHGGRNSPIIIARDSFASHFTGGDVVAGRYVDRTPLISNFGIWFMHAPGKLAVLVALSGVFAWVASDTRLRYWLCAEASAMILMIGRVRSIAVVFSVSLLAYTFMLTEGHWNIFRPSFLGAYFEQHAEGLLSGTLEVTPESIGSEAFRFEGKTYGYFGPTPALFRLLHATFNLPQARSARPLMLIYYAVTLVAAVRTLYTLGCLVEEPARHRLHTLSPILIAGLAVGSPLYFISSMASVHHEAIACGVMFSFLSMAYLLQGLVAGCTRKLWMSLALGALAILSRPTVAISVLSLATVLLMISAAFPWKGRGNAAITGLSFRPRPGHLKIAAGFVFAAFLPSIVSYLKFRDLSGCPLRYHCQYNTERIAHIGGRLFHAANLHINSDFYFLRSNLAIVRNFPFFLYSPPGRTNNIGSNNEQWDRPHVSPTPTAPYSSIKIDWFEPSVGLPYGCPLLVGIGLAGMFGAVKKCRHFLLLYAAIAVAFIPLAALMLTFIAIAQRYQADFTPLLFVYASVGSLVLCSLEILRSWRRIIFALAFLLGVYSISVNFLLTFRNQGEIFCPGGYAALRYQAVKRFFGEG